MNDLWHPFTQLKGFTPRGTVVSASGSWLTLEDGRRVLDGISSWWVTLHGHCHPAIVAAIAKQAAAFDQVILADFAHRPAVHLSKRLARRLPGDLNHIFYSDDGSTAVEVALKMAVQAQHQRAPHRHKIVAFDGAYHGDTVGAMSVGDRGIFSAPFEGMLFDVDFLPYGDADAADEYFDQHGHEVVAVIVEPLVQGASGMRFATPESLRRLRSVTRTCGAMLIADEVMTGFGRTGTMWACDRAKVVPDLMCVSKGVTGGSLTIGITAASTPIFEGFLGDSTSEAFLHGHSYTGNPIACAAGLASLDLFETEHTLDRVIGIESVYRRRAVDFEAIENIENVRFIGGIFAYDVSGGEGGYLDPIGRRIADRTIDRGLYSRPLGNTMYLMPPLCTTPEEVDAALDVLVWATQAELGVTPP